MKKRSILNKNSSIIVNFDCSDKKVNKLLKDIGLSGTRVSNIISRWAIDVPFWKEDYYVEKLLESDLVERIYLSPRKYQEYSEDQQ
jgi:hypothetical protein